MHVALTMHTLQKGFLLLVLVQSDFPFFWEVSANTVLFDTFFVGLSESESRSACEFQFNTNTFSLFRFSLNSHNHSYFDVFLVF